MRLALFESKRWECYYIGMPLSSVLGIAAGTHVVSSSSLPFLLRSSELDNHADTHVVSCLSRSFVCRSCQLDDCVVAS
jgi:hypothetical protein